MCLLKTNITTIISELKKKKLVQENSSTWNLETYISETKKAFHGKNVMSGESNYWFLLTLLKSGGERFNF